eukprot:jgi/Hompol1/5498/HPOL_000200-RA
MESNQPISLDSLPLQQLQQVRQQVEEEIEVLTDSFAKLRQAQAKFSESIESLKAISSKSSDKTILLADVEKVIVDVGTGYFVEKTPSDATDFYKRKVDYIRSNLEQLQQTITQRQNNRSAVLEAIQIKQMQIMKESQAAKATAAQ